MIDRVFVFPGQGSQAIGMGRALAEASEAARAVFAQVDAALEEDLSGLMFQGDAAQLVLTENAQPALLAVSMAALAALEGATGRPLSALCRFVAGHSLGEYTALAAAGAIDLADAARLLRLRGKAMQSAVPLGRGAMAAILGLDLDTVRAVAVEATGQGEICAVANDNAPGQVVVSGDTVAVERAMALAKARGAKRNVLLPVSAPFHCPLMAPARHAMAEALATVTIRPPVVPLIANVTAAEVVAPAEIRQCLIEQVVGTVRWRESMIYAADAGITEIVEPGAGKVLTGLARRIDNRLTGRSVQTPQDVSAAAQELCADATMA